MLVRAHNLKTRKGTDFTEEVRAREKKWSAD